MTVAELIEKLKEMPQDAKILAEGEEADKVAFEDCQGYKWVRIFKSWDMNLVLGSAGLRGDDNGI